MNIYEALNDMRSRSDQNVPFSFTYLSCNTTDKSSKGLKRIENALLRTGFSREVSDKSEILIAYTDLSTNKPGFFYLPLLFKLNNTLLDD